MLLSLTACGTKDNKDNNTGTTGENVKSIEISVYDKSGEEIYDKKIETGETKLYDALMKIDDLKIESESSQYGEFITSINGVAQEEDYYWNYYVNGDYASVGVSGYIIKDSDQIKFALEKFE